MRLSFIIPSYNCAEFIHPAIDSCLSQSHKGVEVVVVDDGSIDSTPEYLAWLENQNYGGRVRVIRNERNLGRSASRNIGNAAATGDIIAVCDADDLSMPKRAELTIARFEKGAQFVHGAAHIMDAVGRERGMMPTDVFNKEKAIETLSAGMVHSTFAYTKDLAMKYPYLSGDPARLGVDDFCFVMSLAMDGIKFDYIQSPIAVYRANDFGITATRDVEEVEKFKKGFIDSFCLAKI